MFYELNFFEQNPNYQVVKTDSGENLVLLSDGLAGELSGDRGWFATYKPTT